MDSPASFESYLAAELGWLRALALQLVREAAAADDLVQEAVLAALARRPELEGQLGARPWLARVMRNLSSNARRSRQRRSARELAAARDEALPDASELAAHAESQRALSNAVHALDEPYRSVILLRYFHGLEPAQIAARRNVPAATVRSQLSRAHEQLRGALDRSHGGDSRAWCVALAPLFVDRPELVQSAAVSLTTVLGVFLMNHWIALSVAAVFAAALGLGLRDSDPAAPDSRGAATAVATQADVERPAEPAPADLVEPARSVVSSVAAVPPSQARARLRGRVVDQATREPLAGYFVTLPRADGDIESLSTDTLGQFESAFEREPGAFELRLSAERERESSSTLNGSTLSWTPGITRSVTWDGVRPLELEFEYRLRVPLRFSPPTGLSFSDFRVELRDLDPNEAPLEAILFAIHGRVRGDPPVARFMTTGVLGDAVQRKLLRLVSDDGLWRGQAWFDVAGNTTPVEIALESCGVARFELLSATAQALAEPTLEIQELPDGRISRRDANDLAGPAHNQAVVDGLAPGSYRFVARASGMRDAAVELQIASGVELRHVFVLEPMPDAATISGELRSRSGQFKERVTVALPAAAGGQFRTAIVEWIERDGAWVAPFEFKGLRPGKHDVQFYLWDGSNRSWTPAGGEIEAPAEQVVFVCDDLSPLQTLRFDVVDDATGVPLPNASAQAREGRRWLIEADAPAGAPRTFSISQGMEVSWTVSCDGYESQSGDSRSAVLVDGSLRQHVRLKPVQ